MNLERVKAGRWAGHKFRVMQAKLDGHWVDLHRDQHGVVTATGSDPRPDLELTSRFDRVKTIAHSVLCRFDPATHVVGELHVPGMKASMVPRAMRDPDLPLEFVAFALPQLNGVDLRGRDPWDDTLSIVEATGVPVVETYSMEHVRDVFGDPYTANPEPFLTTIGDAARRKKLEGWVFKRRTWAEWYKWKLESTIDAVIIGTRDGNNKYFGTLGALRVAVYRDGKLVEIASVSGMTDEERDELDDMATAGQLVGKVVEVKYQYLGDGDRLRHPRFLRLRDDKPAAECTWEQLEA